MVVLRSPRCEAVNERRLHMHGRRGSTEGPRALAIARSLDDQAPAMGVLPGSKPLADHPLR